MESFLILLSVISLGTINPLNKPVEPLYEAKETKSLELSQKQEPESNDEITQAPNKILALCREKVELNYKDPASDTTHYKCSGVDVVFFSIGKKFYASVASEELADGYSIIKNERLSRSLNRQVRKMYNDASMQAKNLNELNNKF